MDAKLTSEQSKRVAEEMKHTARQLEKELRYLEDLQDKAMINFYRNHIAKLAIMLMAA